MSASRGVNVDAMIGMYMVLYGDSCIDEGFISCAMGRYKCNYNYFNYDHCRN